MGRRAWGELRQGHLGGARGREEGEDDASVRETRRSNTRRGSRAADSGGQGHRGGGGGDQRGSAPV
jgi:hypothetical protein